MTMLLRRMRIRIPQRSQLALKSRLTQRKRMQLLMIPMVRIPQSILRVATPLTKQTAVRMALMNRLRCVCVVKLDDARDDYEAYVEL